MYTLQTARATAERILIILEPHCNIIQIAGSIRRQKQYVKDIEIVCQPKKVFVQTEMFGGGRWDVCDDFHEALVSIEEFRIKGMHTGRYLQSVLKGGITMDLFMPQPEDYYRQLVIRTGSKDYVEKIIAASWKRKGWVGAGEHGLRKQTDCQPIPNAGKTKWKLVNMDGEKPPAWKSEEEFYYWLDLQYMPPVLREWKSTLNPAI